MENFNKIKVIKKIFNNNHSNQDKMFKIFDKINFQTYRSTLYNFENTNLMEMNYFGIY